MNTYGAVSKELEDVIANDDREGDTYLTHYETDCFCEKECVCDEYADEDASWAAEEQAAYEASDAAAQAEIEAQTAGQPALTEEEMDAAVAQAEAQYDAWWGKR